MERVLWAIQSRVVKMHFINESKCSQFLPGCSSILFLTREPKGHLLFWTRRFIWNQFEIARLGIFQFCWQLQSSCGQNCYFSGYTVTGHVWTAKTHSALAASHRELGTISFKFSGAIAMDKQFPRSIVFIFFTWSWNKYIPLKPFCLQLSGFNIYLPNIPSVFGCQGNQ